MAIAATTKSIAGKPTCLVKGGKHIAPAMDDSAICARMLSGVQAGARLAGIQSIAIRFLPQGVASAEVVHGAKGKSRRDTFEIAVSDRRLSPQDIDRLAKDIVSAIGSSRK